MKVRQKKKYKKPSVGTVKLQPEETISLGCWRGAPSTC